MASPDDRRYSKEHEWIRTDGEIAYIGITDYAQDQLGDVVYVDLPETGATITQFEKMGEIESVKAVSELYAPASGEVVMANDEVVQKPELVNEAGAGEHGPARPGLAAAGEAHLPGAARHADERAGVRRLLRGRGQGRSDRPVTDDTARRRPHPDRMEATIDARTGTGGRG